MSISRLYRDRTEEDGRRTFEYREAWIDPSGELFTVHHGRVGHPGTVGDQPLTSEADGAELMDAFLAQGEADGFAPADEDAFDVLEVAYRLRGRAITEIERRHGQTLREEVTHQLAWRGLGEVTDVVDGDGELVLVVRTPHAPKAAAEVPAAAKRAHGIQPNKVEVRRVDGPRTPAGAAPDAGGEG